MSIWDLIWALILKDFIGFGIVLGIAVLITLVYAVITYIKELRR